MATNAVIQVKNPPANAGDIRDPWVRKLPWRRAWQPTPVFLPGVEEPDELQSMESQRVGHDCSDLAHTQTSKDMERKISQGLKRVINQWQMTKLQQFSNESDVLYARGINPWIGRAQRLTMVEQYS